MVDSDTPYLHLEIARAKRAVLQARMKLVTCELSEQMLQTRLHRQKMQNFKRELEEVNTTVGHWCDAIRGSGRPLHSPVVQRRSRRRHRACELSIIHSWHFTDLLVYLTQK